MEKEQIDLRQAMIEPICEEDFLRNSLRNVKNYNEFKVFFSTWFETECFKTHGVAMIRNFGFNCVNYAHQQWLFRVLSVNLEQFPELAGLMYDLLGYMDDTNNSLLVLGNLAQVKCGFSRRKVLNKLVVEILKNSDLDFANVEAVLGLEKLFGSQCQKMALDYVARALFENRDADKLISFTISVGKTKCCSNKLRLKLLSRVVPYLNKCYQGHFFFDLVNPIFKENFDQKLVRHATLILRKQIHMGIHMAEEAFVAAWNWQRQIFGAENGWKNWGTDYNKNQLHWIMIDVIEIWPAAKLDRNLHLALLLHLMWYTDYEFIRVWFEEFEAYDKVEVEKILELIEDLNFDEENLGNMYVMRVFFRLMEVSPESVEVIKEFAMRKGLAFE